MLARSLSLSLSLSASLMACSCTITVYRYANGDVYEGEFSMDEFHGKGKYIGVNGITYEGDFSQGARVRTRSQYSRSLSRSLTHTGARVQTGQGMCTLRNGDKYIGGFLNGKFQGQGGTPPVAQGHHGLARRRGNSPRPNSNRVHVCRRRRYARHVCCWQARGGRELSVASRRLCATLLPSIMTITMTTMTMCRVDVDVDVDVVVDLLSSH